MIIIIIHIINYGQGVAKKMQSNLAILNSVNSKSLLFQSQADSPSFDHHLVLTRLFWNTAILNYFSCPMGLQNSEVRLYVSFIGYSQEILATIEKHLILKGNLLCCSSLSPGSISSDFVWPSTVPLYIFLCRATLDMDCWQEEAVCVTLASLEGALDWLWKLKRNEARSSTCTVEAIAKALQDEHVSTVGIQFIQPFALISWLAIQMAMFSCLLPNEILWYLGHIHAV